MGTRVSVPGRVIFGGDHSRAFDGEGIVAGAVDLRLRVAIDRRDDRTVAVRSPFLGQEVDLDALLAGEESVERLSLRKSDRALPYFAIVGRILDRLDLAGPDLPGFTVRIDPDDDFSLGVGLGSSSAVVVATIAGLAAEFGDPLADETVESIAADVEAAFFDDALRADPATIVAGGFVATGDGVERVSDAAIDVLLGVVKTRSDREQVMDRVSSMQEATGPLYDDIRALADGTTRRLTEKIASGALATVPDLLTFYGDLFEGMGFSSWPVPEVRSAELAHTDFPVGAKQSDFGQRALLLTVPGADADLEELARALERSGGEAIPTRTTPTGLSYLD